VLGTTLQLPKETSIVKPEDIVGLDQQVTLLDGSRLTYAFLDNAASTPAFRRSHKKVSEALQWYASVHRGAGYKSMVSTRLYERARDSVKRFVGADPNSDCVIFCRNTTEAINILAGHFKLGPDDVIICTLMEHHSNDLPWRRLGTTVHVDVGQDGELDLDEYQRLLARFEGRVKLVAVTGASNVSGLIPPVHKLAQLAHQYGAPILVDCAQLAPHRAVDMRPTGAADHLDFITLSAHKMYAPFGAGVLVGPRAFFGQTPPTQQGGGTVEIVTKDEVHWAPPPERDEAGSPNVLGAVALAASIAQLSEIGMDAIAAHEAELTSYALHEMQRVRGLRVYGSADPERTEDRLGVISFELEGLPHAKVAAVLSFEAGIGVRNGCFCAHPYVLRLLDVDSDSYQVYRARVLARDRTDIPGLVRVSFGCYNSFQEVDRLVESLIRISVGNYLGDYEVDPATGMYFPRLFDVAMLDRHFDF
jgi:selenocysteine lyase/cysteine desulfurase